MGVFACLLRLLFVLLGMLLPSEATAPVLELNEARFNALLASALDDDVYVDFIPNALYVSTSARIGGRLVSLGATIPVWAQYGEPRAYVSQVWVEGRPAPGAVTRLVNDTLLPRISGVIGDLFRQELAAVCVTDITITDTRLSIYFTYGGCP